MTPFQVVARFLAASTPSMAERIEAILGWERSNFLRSLHDQASRGRALSPKQVAVIEKIEAEQGVRSPKLAPGTISFGGQHESGVILKALRKEGLVKVYDPKGLINKGLLDRWHHELALDFEGLAEMYAEYNADEDDPKQRAFNSKMMGAADKASHEMREGQVTFKDGVVEAHPHPKDLARKYHLY